jgi:GTPase SAR1 family protein
MSEQRLVNPIFIGPAESGKSQILSVLRRNIFNNTYTSISVDNGFFTKNDTSTKVKIWDVAGKDNGTASIALLTQLKFINPAVYIVLSAEDLQNVGTLKTWLDFSRTYLSGIPISLIVNKVDLSSEGDAKTAVNTLLHDAIVKQHINSQNILYCSAKTGHGIDALKQKLCDGPAIAQSNESLESDTQTTSDAEQENKTKSFSTWVKNHWLDLAIGVPFTLLTLAILILAVFFPTVLAVTIPFLSIAITFISNGLIAMGMGFLPAPAIAFIAVSVIGLTAMTVFGLLYKIGDAICSTEKPDSLVVDVPKQIVVNVPTQTVAQTILPGGSNPLNSDVNSQVNSPIVPPAHNNPYK